MAYTGSIWGKGGGTVKLNLGDVQQKINHLRFTMTKDNFNKVMYRTFGEVAKKAGVIIAKEVTKDYAVPQAWVKQSVGRYKLTMTGNVKCVIPLSGKKGTEGPKARFKARALKRGRISVKILKLGRPGKLPPKIENQGGNAPFVVTGGKMAGLVATRRTKEKFPVVRVVGLGAPQMPLNRSEDKMWEALLEYTDERLDHHIDRMLQGKF